MTLFYRFYHPEKKLRFFIIDYCNDVGNATGFMMDLTSSKSSDLCHWPQSARDALQRRSTLLPYHRGQTFFSKNPKTFMMVGSLGNCWLYQEKSKVTTSRFFKSQIVLRCARLFATRRQSSIEEIVEKELHMTSPTPCRLMDLGVRPSARLFTKIFSDK